MAKTKKIIVTEDEPTQASSGGAFGFLGGNAKDIVHVGVEVAAIGGVAFYFYRRCGQLEGQIVGLTAECAKAVAASEESAKLVTGATKIIDQYKDYLSSLSTQVRQLQAQLKQIQDNAAQIQEQQQRVSAPPPRQQRYREPEEDDQRQRGRRHQPREPEEEVAERVAAERIERSELRKREEHARHVEQRRAEQHQHNRGPSSKKGSQSNKLNCDGNTCEMPSDPAYDDDAVAEEMANIDRERRKPSQGDDLDDDF